MKFVGGLGVSDTAKTILPVSALEPTHLGFMRKGYRRAAIR